MNIVEQVVSLELSKKLAEAGYPQEGLFSHVLILEKGETEATQHIIFNRLETPEEYVFITGDIVKSVYAAPTVSELMEQIPVTRPTERHLQITKWDNATGGHFFAVDYGIVDHNGFSDVSLANACAKMWLWLMEVEGEDLR